MIPKFLCLGHELNAHLRPFSRESARHILTGYPGLWLHKQCGMSPDVSDFIVISEAAILGIDVIITIGQGPSMKAWREVRYEYATIKDIPLCVEVCDLPNLKKLIFGGRP